MTLPTPPIHKAPRWAPVLECLAMVGVGTLLNLLVYPGDPGFVGLQPHPTLIVVLVIGLRYGFRASIMAVILTSVAYGLLLLQLAEVPTYLYLLDPPYSTPAVILVPLGVVVGLLSQKHIDRVAAVVTSNELLFLENQSLRGEHEELRDVNLELAGRVVGAEGTVGQLYEFAKQLNVADERQIFEGLLHLLGQSLGAEKSTIWRVRDTGLEFLACTQDGPPESHHPPECARYESLFDDRGVLALHDIPEQQRAPNLPFLLGRLKEGQNGQLLAYVAVDTMPFARYNEEAIRLFRMIIEWASTSLGNVHTVQPAAREIQPNLPAPAQAMTGFPVVNTIEHSLQQLSASRQAAVSAPARPVPPTAPAAPRPRFPEAQEVATVLDAMRNFPSAPAPSQHAARNAFVPSVSVILLNEAGASDAGNLGSGPPGPEPAPRRGPEPAPRRGPEPAPRRGPEPAPQRGPEPAPQRGPFLESQTIVYQGDQADSSQDSAPKSVAGKVHDRPRPGGKRRDQ